MTVVSTAKRNRLVPALFEDFFNERFFDSPFFKVNGSNGSLVPDVNVIENPANFQIEIAAPGLDRNDFKVEVANGLLNISAEKKEEKNEEGKNYTRKEFSYNSFSRSFQLPDNLVADDVDAKYDNGVLRLTLPKKELSEPEQAKQVTVG